MKGVILRMVAAFLASCTCLFAQATVSASLDRTHIAQGETVRLLLQNDGRSDEQPDLAPLQKNFNILSTRRGSSTQIVNGQISSQTQIILFLSPRQEGTIHIPPLRWGTEESAALELIVGGNGDKQEADQSTDTPPVSMTATIDQKHPYVQSAVVLTLRLFVGTQLSQASLDLPGSSDVLVKQLGEDTQTSESRNGRNYQVIERKYVLVPQRSGQISLKGPTLEAQVPDTDTMDPSDIHSLFGRVFGQSPLGRMMGSTRPLRLSASAIEMNVLPRPAAAAGAHWLPAQEVTLEESWRPDNGILRVGEPLTRHLRLTASGVTAAQLPDLGQLMTVPDGIKLYPDQSKMEDKLRTGTMLGSRDQDIALMASKPGRYELPALRLSWWDTTSNTQREARLPARTLDILPGDPVVDTSSTVGTRPASVAAENLQFDKPLHSTTFASVSIWQWTSAAFALLWFGTLLAWWRSSRSASRVTPLATLSSRPVKLSSGKALSAFQRACQGNDPQAARRHLLAWAVEFWPESPPRGLHAVALRLDDVKLTKLLQQLDRACYTDINWRGESLAQAFATMPKNKYSKKTKSVIPDLYGSS